MWAAEIPPHFEPSVRRLQDELGLTVILAHPERMRAVQDRPELADYFADLDILLQGNLQCLSDRPDAATRQVVESYLLDDRYFLLGSDSHNPETMDIRMNGLARAIDLVGEAKVNELTITNPRKLVPNLFPAP
jgi:tyrosine-protein phosphatase YwqE